MTFQQQVKHALAVLAVYSVIGATSTPMAWAASGVLQTIQISPDKHTLQFRSTGPVTATMNSMRVGPNQRIILDLKNAEIGVDLPRDPLLLQELAAQWPGIRNISINQFGGSEPIVRILLDVDGGTPAPQLLQVSGNIIELKLAGSIPIASAPITSGSSLTPPTPSFPSPSQTRTSVTISNTVDTHAYETALKTIEEQRTLLQKLQTELFQLKSQGGGSAPQNGQYLQQETERLRTANQSLQNQLFNLYEEQKRNKDKETQLLAAQAQAKKLQDELVWLKAENDKLSALPAAKAVTPTELTQLRTELDNARTALNKSVATINTQNKEIAALKTRITDVQKGLDASAKDQLTTLNNILIQKEAELEKRNTEAVQLRKEVAAFKAQPAIATQAEVDSLKRQLEEVSLQYRNAVAESNRQQQLSSAKVGEYDQLKLNTDNLVQQVQYLEAELNKAKAQHNTALANYNRLQAEQVKLSGQSDKDVRVAELQQQLTAAQQKHQATLDETQRLTLALNTQNRELRDKLGAMELENTSLKARPTDTGKVAMLEKQSRDLSLKLADAEKEMNRLYAELASKEEGKTETIANLERQLATTRRQLQAEQARATDQAGKDVQIADLERQLASVQQTLQDEQDRARTQAGKDTRIAELEQQLTATQQKHQSALDETQKLTLALNTQNRELHDKLSAMELENTNLKARSTDTGKVAMLEKQSRELSLKLADAEKEINRLYAEQASKMEGRTEAITRLEQENATLARHLEDVKAQLSQAQSRTLTAESQDAQVFEQRKALQEKDARLTELQAENRSLTAQLKADQSEQALALQTALQEKQQAEKSLAELQKQRSGQGASLESALKEKQALADTLAQREKELQQARQGDSQQLAALQTELQTLKRVNQELETRLQAATADDASVKALETSLQDKTQQVERLQQENASLLAALRNKPSEQSAAAVAENTEAQEAKIIELRQRLANSETELATSKGQLETLQAQLKETKTAAKKTPTSTKDDKRLQSELAEMKKESARLRQELADARSGAPQAMVATAHPQADKHFQLGRDFESNGQPDLAIQEYQRAASLAPTNSEYVFRYSLALAEQKQLDRAISQLQAYLAQHPHDREAFNQIGKVYLLNNQPDEAKSAFRHAIPSSVLNNYATVLKKQGKMDEAEQFFKLAVELNPADSDILFNLGNLYNTSSKLNEARASYERAIGLRPDFAEAHYNLGLVYSKMGDKQSAVTHLERFLELSPNTRNADAIRSYLQKLKGA